MRSGAVISWSSPRAVQRARPPAAARGDLSQRRRSEAPCVPPRATDAESGRTPPSLSVPAPVHSRLGGRGGIHRMSSAQMWDAGIVTLMLGVMLLAVIVLYVAVGYPLGLGVS